MLIKELETLHEQKRLFEENKSHRIKSLQKEENAIRGYIRTLDTHMAVLKEKLNGSTKVISVIMFLLFTFTIGTLVVYGTEEYYGRNIEEMNVQLQKKKQLKKEIMKQISSIKDDICNYHGREQDLMHCHKRSNVRILPESEPIVRGKMVSIPHPS